MVHKPPAHHNGYSGKIYALEVAMKGFEKLMEERDKRYQQRSDSQDVAVKAALENSEKAIIKAEAATERRLEGLNELRDMAIDQAGAFARKEDLKVYDVKLQALDETVKTLMGRSGGIKETWGYVVGFGGLLLATITLWFHSH
jgi:hypothetical protein